MTPSALGLLSAFTLVSTQPASKKMPWKFGTLPMPVISRDVKRQASSARSIHARSAALIEHAGADAGAPS